MLHELAAWLWLLRLERVDWEATPYPIRLRVVPGALGENCGALYVRASIAHPGLPGKRVQGGGNSLWETVGGLHRDLWNLGVKVEFPQNVYDEIRACGVEAAYRSVAPGIDRRRDRWLENCTP